MSHDATQTWAQKRSGQAPQSRGAQIMEIAEKLRPVLTKFFEGVRDDQGMLLQPAHIRGIALNMAQNLLKAQA